MAKKIDDPARCIPVLASLDIAETYDYYVDQLGFRGDRIGDYLIVKRDEMEIHFWLAKDRIHPENTSCYIRGGQVPALYEEFKARGVAEAFRLRRAAVEHEGVLHPRSARQPGLRFGCAPEEVC